MNCRVGTFRVTLLAATITIVSLTAPAITFNEPGFNQTIVAAIPGPGASSLHYGGVVVGPDANIYVGGGGRPDVYRVTPAGAVTPLSLGATGFVIGVGMVGNTLYVGQSNGRVDTFDTSLPAPVASFLTTVPGSLGNHGNSDFAAAPAGFGAFGGQLIACNGGVYALDPVTGAKTDIAIPGGGPLASLDFGPNGTLYVAEPFSGRILAVTSAGGVTTFATTASLGIDGVAVHQGTGDIYVADSGNDTIIKITPGGVITTFATEAYFDIGTWPSGLAFNGDNTVLYYLTHEGSFQLAAIDGFPPVAPLALADIPTIGDAGIVIFAVLIGLVAIAVIRQSLV